MKRLFAMLAHFWRHDLPLPVSEGKTERGNHLRVLLDGKSIADLDWTYDDQPLHYYRLTPIDPDRSKIVFSLGNGSHAVEQAERVLLLDRTNGSLVVHCLFIPHINWDIGAVSVRSSFVDFVPPLRDPLPKDDIPGFGSVADAHAIVREVIRHNAEMSSNENVIS